jgi:filamentous hemagglutinin family protein
MGCFPLPRLGFAAFLALLIWLVIPGGASADVVRDGTIGPGVEVQPEGPGYQIPEGHGERYGSNLFHSFHEFGLTSDQSATFTGSGGIENVLGRVTGGSPSSINGLIASEISGADLLLINPSGVLFGENARLDVSGSFHATTAD